MKSVLISIRPHGCELIVEGRRDWEIRKTKPKIKPPFKVLIYETKDKEYDGIGVHWAVGRHFFHHIGKVIGEFVCDDIAKIQNLIGMFVAEERSDFETNTIARGSCLDFSSMKRYLGEKDGYAWHISDFKLYDEPRELSEFWKADKCPYASEDGCTYKYHCFRAGQTKRCGDTLTRPPQSWCYVEEQVRKE